MSYPNSFYATWEPRVLSILRIVAALLLMQHGAQKLFGYPPQPPPTPQQQQAAQQQQQQQQSNQQQQQSNQQQQQQQQPSRGLPPLILVAAILELFGGLLVLVGFFTRPMAFILSGLMAVAYFMAHGSQMLSPTLSFNLFWPITNKGELAALYSFVFLYLAVAGGGMWSVDYCLRRSDGRIA